MFVEALEAAAARGVSVEIIVPGPHIDKQLVRSAGRAVYADLQPPSPPTATRASGSSPRDGRGARRWSAPPRPSPH